MPLKRLRNMNKRLICADWSITKEYERHLLRTVSKLCGCGDTTMKFRLYICKSNWLQFATTEASPDAADSLINVAAVPCGMTNSISCAWSRLRRSIRFARNENGLIVYAAPIPFPIQCRIPALACSGAQQRLSHLLLSFVSEHCEHRGRAFDASPVYVQSGKSCEQQLPLCAALSLSQLCNRLRHSHAVYSHCTGENCCTEDSQL